MALTPFRGFWDTQSEFDRMFDDVMRDFLGRAAGRGGAGTREQLWAPRLEAFARDGDLVLHADLPGVSLEDVDITLDANVLTISGARVRPRRKRASPATSTSCPTALSAGA